VEKKREEDIIMAVLFVQEEQKISERFAHCAPRSNKSDASAKERPHCTLSWAAI
jgi:hypothetical protein